MKHQSHLALAAVVVMLLAACGTDQSALQPNEPVVDRPLASAGSYTCNPNYDIGAQIVALWTDAPNLNSATSKWNQVQHQQSINPTPSSAVTDATTNLVEFILHQYRQGKLQPPNGMSSADYTAALLELLNQIYCNAGLDISLTSLDAWIIYQNDVEKTFVAADGNTGVTVPANSVPTTAVISVACNATQQLNTPLDQYPYVCNWSLQPDQALLNGKRATVTVCPSGIAASNTALLNRLALGHEKNGFEILPAPTANDPAAPQLNCDSFLSLAQSSTPLKWLAKAADLLLPQKLQAMFFFGGASGATSEFSPFAPVDPRLSVVGASGSTGEFTPPALGPDAAPPLSCTYGNTVTVNSVSYPVNPEGPVGTSVDAMCRPSTTIRTAQGTLIAGIPVAFQIGTTVGGGFALPTAGNGTLRFLSGNTCGATGFQAGAGGAPSTAVNDGTSLPATGATGTASVCADFGSSAGYNSILATPQTLNLPAPLQGVYFDVTSLLWVMESNPASQLVFTAQPPATVTAGAAFGATVALRDRNGQQTGSSETVSLALANASVTSPAFSGAGPFSAAATNGAAAFTNLVVTRAATGYSINASATLPGPVAGAATSSTFDVVAGAAANIQTYMAPPTPAASYAFGSFPAFSSTPLAPVVLVTDSWGNKVGSGAGVYWTPTGATGSVVNPASSTTLANGTSTTAWTLGEGPNELYATLVPVATQLSPFAEFTATGTTTLAVVNSCSTGGAKDDIRDYGFRTVGVSKEVRSIGVYLSITGNVSGTNLFDMQLTGRRTYTPKNSSTPTTDVFTSRLRVSLRGDNSSNAENKLVTFALGGSSGFPAVAPANVNGQQPAIDWRLSLVDPSTLPSNRTINMNAGTCGADGKTCKQLPSNCKSEEITPAGVVYRSGFPVIVKAVQ